MSTHLNEERKKFLEKMLEAYTIENESDAKGPEQLRHYLLRRNNALLQAPPARLFPRLPLIFFPRCVTRQPLSAALSFLLNPVAQ